MKGFQSEKIRSRKPRLPKRSFLWASCLYFGVVFNVSALVKQHSGDLSFRYNQLSSQFGNNDGNRFWTDFNYLYYYHEPFIDEERKFDLSMRINDSGGFMVSVKEAQITELGKNYEVSFGRLLVNWSEIDKTWGLGKINNRKNFDFFEPGQEGLLGVRFKKSLGDYFVLDVFASAFYIPQLNPASRINSGEGSITSKNPWANTPPSSITDTTLAADPIRIFYRVDTPAIQDIFFKESYGANFVFRPIEEISVTAFYLYKPENELTQDIKIVPDINPNLQIEVFVNPAVYDHRVYGGQLEGLFWNRLKIYGSYIVTKPGTKPEEPANIDLIDLGFAFDTDKQKEEYVGSGIEYLGPTLKLGIGFISRISDFVKTTTLTRSPRWSQAVHLFGSLQLFESFSAMFDIKYDTLTYDRLYMVDIGYRPFEHLKVSVGANVIGTPDNGQGYWAPFRTNDTFYAQLGVLF